MRRQSLNAKYVSSIQRITTKRIALGKVPVVRCASTVGKLSITWQQTVQRHGILQINKAINGNVVKGEARKEILAHVYMTKRGKNLISAITEDVVVEELVGVDHHTLKINDRSIMSLLTLFKLI
ncbi:hypothetical protein QAD02_000395 [Eretmocerus hayati]|uniref:Uncharacterized protein n=1 Tax=Eretmocerus hayati TaxID=131215 RepID=A0ACC2NE06_9HYME|nr:hypothetical protein QAD02_000395 [Eretmocerus hayati]